MIVGIVIVSGMVGELKASTRILVGGAVLLYILLRVLFMQMSRRDRYERGKFSVNNYLDKGENSDPNNT